VPARPLPPRHQVRATSARALVAFQAGQPREAARLYAEALDIAERHGLGDQLASAALNLAAAQHQRGAGPRLAPPMSAGCASRSRSASRRPRRTRA
jgi:hypothetical protein